jgi:TIR domain
MADVFISYARADRSVAEQIAKAISDEGWSVWWDRDLSAGEPFGQIISAQLEKAKAVVVIWTNASVVSDWVVDEASEALKRNILVPIAIGDARPPLGFRRLHTIVVPTTDPAPLYSGIKDCVAAIAKSFGVPHEASGAPQDPLSSIRRRLLAARTYHDLKVLQAEIEVFRATHPPSSEVIVLERQVAGALTPRGAPLGYEAPMMRSRRFNLAVAAVKLLLLLGAAYAGWKLIEYLMR